MTEGPCIFCEIVAGTAPVSRILETEQILVLVPLRPKSEGHTLVIPKQHAERLHDVPERTRHEMIDAIARIARSLDLENYHVLQNTGPETVGAAGPAPEEFIQHVHVHLIPRRAGDGVDILTRSRSAPPRAELDRLAGEIRKRLA